MAKIKRGIYPAPVYVAEFGDGTMGRASFWSPEGKPIDFERGRRVVATLYSRPDHGHWSRTYPPCVVRRGWVEHPSVGKVEHTPAAVASIKKPTLAAIMKQARAALESGDSTAALALLKLAA